MLTPHEKLKTLQDAGNMTELMALSEEIKMLPLGDVWEEYCRRCNVPTGSAWLDDIKKYEQDVLLKR